MLTYALALVLLDQVLRQIWRDTAMAFAVDPQGLALTMQQQLIDKSQDLLTPPPPPPGGNGHGPAIATTPPPGDGVPGPIDVSTNGNQPQQPAEPQDQAKGANDHG